MSVIEAESGAIATETPSPASLGEDFLARFGAGTVPVGSLDAFLQAGPGEAILRWFGVDAARDLDAGALRRRLDRIVAAIDAAVSDQVNAIMAHPRFQALEAAWRGISWLTEGLNAEGMARIRLLDARWAEIVRDFERSPDVERSTLFDIVYNQEFDMPGGVPFSLMLGLYSVQHRPSRDHPSDDVAALRLLSQVAAAAFVPLVLDAAPALFGIEAFGDLAMRQSFATDFRQPDYTRFQSLQQEPDTRFLGIAAPRIRLRGAWRGRSAGDVGFRYEADDRDVLWGPAALALGHICLRAFNDHRWLAATRGVVRDQLEAGIIATLPLVDFATDAPGKALKPPVEVHLSETLDREMADAGFIAIRRVKATPWLAIHNMPSLHRPARVQGSDAARANERLGSMLNYILCVARFAHYIKVIGREWIGSFHSADECESRLQRWLNGFTSGGEDLPYETKARYPLQEGRISVRDIPGKPGSYECSVALKPHFQLDQVTSEFHLVTIVQEARAA